MLSKLSTFFSSSQYAEDVRSGKVLTCELVQLAVERYYRDLRDALDKGWYFDRKAATRAIGFIEKLKHTKGEWAGQRFVLEPWQHFILWNIFGWKNADGESRPEVYSAATVKDQAKICFSDAVEIVKADILQIIEVYDFQSMAYDRWIT